MTVRDNPVKRIIVVRKISGRLAVGVQGTVQSPLAFNLRSVTARKKPSNISSLLCRNGAPLSVTPVEAA